MPWQQQHHWHSLTLLHLNNNNSAHGSAHGSKGCMQQEREGGRYIIGAAPPTARAPLTAGQAFLIQSLQAEVHTGMYRKKEFGQCMGGMCFSTVYQLHGQPPHVAPLEKNMGFRNANVANPIGAPLDRKGGSFTAPKSQLGTNSGGATNSNTVPSLIQRNLKQWHS